MDIKCSNDVTEASNESYKMEYNMLSNAYIS